MSKFQSCAFYCNYILQNKLQDLPRYDNAYQTIICIQFHVDISYLQRCFYNGDILTFNCLMIRTDVLPNIIETTISRLHEIVYQWCDLL